jgi:hypothetical protein
MLRKKQMVGCSRKAFASKKECQQSRARVTEGRFEGKVRVIMVGVLTVAMGKLIRNAKVILVGKLREILQTPVFTRGFTPFWPAILSLQTIRETATSLS